VSPSTLIGLAILLEALRLLGLIGLGAVLLAVLV